MPEMLRAELRESRNHVMELCKLPSNLDYVSKPGRYSRRFTIVIKAIEMYGPICTQVRCNDSGMVYLLEYKLISANTDYLQ